MRPTFPYRPKTDLTFPTLSTLLSNPGGPRRAAGAPGPPFLSPLKRTLASTSLLNRVQGWPGGSSPRSLAVSQEIERLLDQPLQGREFPRKESSRILPLPRLGIPVAIRNADAVIPPLRSLIFPHRKLDPAARKPRQWLRHTSLLSCILSCTFMTMPCVCALRIRAKITSARCLIPSRSCRSWPPCHPGCLYRR